MEKIDLIQTTLPPALQDNLLLEGVGNVNVSSDSGLDTIKAKMDALSSYVQENLNHVNAVDSKVDAVESKVDAVQDELSELKVMMTKLMGMIANQ